MKYNEEKEAAIGLELLTKDELDPAAETKLIEKVLMLVRGLLKDGKKKRVRDFLLRHKHHLDPVAKELIRAELK